MQIITGFFTFSESFLSHFALEKSHLFICFPNFSIILFRYLSLLGLSIYLSMSQSLSVAIYVLLLLFLLSLLLFTVYCLLLLYVFQMNVNNPIGCVFSSMFFVLFIRWNVYLNVSEWLNLVLHINKYYPDQYPAQSTTAPISANLCSDVLYNPCSTFP